MSDAVDTKIVSLGDWRGALLTRIRRLIKEAVPDVTEEVKWRKPGTEQRCIDGAGSLDQQVEAGAAPYSQVVISSRSTPAASSSTAVT